MKSLVLGSSGRVGSALCGHLRQEGDVVGEFDVIRDPRQDARTARLPLDSYDRVFLLAWDVGGAKYLNVPETQSVQLEWNTGILRNVLPQIADAGIHLTFVSSQLAQEPSSAYGITKRLGELWTRAIGGLSVRLWNAYGTVEAISQRSQAISDFVVQAVTTGEIQVLTSGAERKRFVHLDDIAVGLHLAASSSGFDGEVLDLASPVVYSIREVATMVAEIAGVEVSFGDAPGTEASLTNYTNVPGWCERWSLRDGVAEMVMSARRVAKVEFAIALLEGVGPSRQEHEMSEQPNNEVLSDEDLNSAVGGELEGEPLTKGDGLAASGPENNIGSTVC
jgi:nucleoside-diphosphate-sugar epimerase